MVVPESTMSTLPESVLEPDKKRPIPWLRLVVGLVVLGLAISHRCTSRRPTTRPCPEVLYIAGAAMGLNLLTGFNGQISIGHGAFFGIGAFTTAILVVDHGWTFEATIPVGGTARRGRRRAGRLPGAAGEGPLPRADHAGPRRAVPARGAASTSTASAAWPCCSPASRGSVVADRRPGRRPVPVLPERWSSSRSCSSWRGTSSAAGSAGR